MAQKKTSSLPDVSISNCTVSVHSGVSPEQAASVTALALAATAIANALTEMAKALNVAPNTQNGIQITWPKPGDIQ